MGVRDMQGCVVCAFRPNPPSQSSMPGFAWFREALSQTGCHAGNAFCAPLATRWSVALTHPIDDDSGAPVGLAILPLDLLTLNARLLKAVPPDAVVAVIDRNRTIVLRFEDPGTWIGRPGPSPVQPAAGQQSSLKDAAAGPDGVLRQVAVTELPGAGWRVVAGVSQDAALAPTDEALLAAVLGALVLLALALLLAAALALRIVRPVEAPAAVATKGSAGDTGARVPSVAAPAEIGAVAQQFSRMLDARAGFEAALRQGEENLSITLHSIGDAVMATDARGRITRMSPAAA